jgi:hypothetical protein
MNARTGTLRLTGPELDALHTLLSVVLNDPDWFDDDKEGDTIANVSSKVIAVLHQETAR